MVPSVRLCSGVFVSFVGLVIHAVSLVMAVWVMLVVIIVISVLVVPAGGSVVMVPTFLAWWER